MQDINGAQQHFDRPAQRNMQIIVVVDRPGDYQKWLQEQETFAQSIAQAGTRTPDKDKKESVDLALNNKDTAVSARATTAQ